MKLRLLFGTLALTIFSALTFSDSALGQQAAPPSPVAPSLADAARAAQAQKPNSAAPAKVITNDDLAPPPAPATAAAAPQAAPEAPPANPTEAAPAQPGEPAKPAAPTPAAASPAAAADASAESGGCNNPSGDEAIQTELQSAQEELDQLRHDLAQNPMSIPDQNIDMTNFKAGSSGVDLGSPPLSDAQPQAPDRIKEVELEQRIASLKKAATITCDSAENGDIQRKIDDAQKQLTFAQRQLDLDSSSYYSNPNYTQDTDAKAKIDGEQEQVQSLQSEIDSLKQELAASKSN